MTESTMVEQESQVSIRELAERLGIALPADNVVSLSDTEAAAMACCDKTNGACWTQM